MHVLCEILLKTCVPGAGTQNLPGCCSCWLRIHHLHFEQLKAEHLSFPTRPQAPAESNSEMKSTVQLDSCPKNGWTALYILYVLYRVLYYVIIVYGIVIYYIIPFLANFKNNVFLRILSLR